MADIMRFGPAMNNRVRLRAIEMNRKAQTSCFCKCQDLENETVVIPHECHPGCDLTDDEISCLHQILIERTMIEEESVFLVGRTKSVWVAQCDD